MTRRTEIQVGLTVLAALAVTIWGVTWLKEFSIQSKVRTWHVSFPQTGGLGASDEVQVNGIRKGAVQAVALVGDRAVVDLTLSSDITITKDSRVAIRNVGLMGEHVIAVDLHQSGEAYTGRDTISGIYELGMPEMMARMSGPMESVDHLAQSLDHIASRLDKNGDLDQTVSNFRETSEQLKRMMQQDRALMHETVQNARDVSRTARTLTTEREAQYKRMFDSMEKSLANAERLTARLDSLSEVSKRVMDKADHGDGTMARLLNDAKLYDDLRGSVKAMQDVLQDLKKNPRKYINLRIF